MGEVLGAAALLVALVALALSYLAWRPRRRTDGSDLPDDVRGLRGEVAALRAENADSLRHVAVVRYDAFEDVGGHLSWSLVLADDAGDGVLVSSIHGRSESRTYAKSIGAWACPQELSPEESEALRQAKGGR